MKVRPTYKPGDDHLFQLFDTSEMEHVCDLLVGIGDPVPRADREVLAAALRKLLGKPIEALLNRIIESGRGANAVEWGPMERFAIAVEATAVRLPEPLNGDEAKELARGLRAAWLEAIAYASAYRMYSDLPREFELNRRKTAALLDTHDAAVFAARVDHDLIRADYARRKAAGERKIAETLAEEYRRSVGGIKNIWSKRDKTRK